MMLIYEVKQAFWGYTYLMPKKALIGIYLINYFNKKDYI